ncbi:cyclin-dependent kinase inhibitor 5-like protein [Tanacetum coccineum]
MGKYMRRRKPKTATAELSLIEVLPSLSGVLTRAKTLALKNGGAVSGDGGGGFLQLRSRRLVKKKVVANDENKDAKLVTENEVKTEATGRTTRETTPCSLIRNPDVLRTPGSSTKPKIRSTTHIYSVQNNTLPRIVPLASEMEEFLAGPEKEQQRLFMEKYTYNFDPVNDKPLPGRYEWVKLDATEYN